MCQESNSGAEPLNLDLVEALAGLVAGKLATVQLFVGQRPTMARDALYQFKFIDPGLSQGQ
jgi:hypothetical protein